MSARAVANRRRRVVRLPKPARAGPTEHHCPTPYLDSPEAGLRVLALALEGLRAQTFDWELDSAGVRRELDPLMCLLSDIQDVMGRGDG